MIDEKQLREDLLAAKQAFAYAKGFRLRLLRKDKLTSFLVYLVENGRQFPVRVELSDYPLVHFPRLHLCGRSHPAPCIKPRRTRMCKAINRFALAAHAAYRG